MPINIKRKDTSVEGVFKAVNLLESFYKSQQNDKAFRKFYSHVVTESDGMADSSTLPRKKARSRRTDEGSQSQLATGSNC